LSDDGVGQQLVGNNGLFLAYRAVGPENPVASKVQVRREVVKMLRPVGFVSHSSAQLLAINPTQ
jgi:hypothetical protein